MMPQLAGLTDKGIQDYIDNLKYQISIDAMWSNLAKSGHGEFLMVQLRRELEFWRNQYSQIDASSPAAANLLSFIQGIEIFATRIINSINEGGNQAEVNKSEIESIGEFLKLRKNQKIGQTLLPTGYVKKEKSK